jgi:alanine dehydrogenase
MCTVGILKDNRGLTNTVFSPTAIRSFNNEVNFIVESDAGNVNLITDNEYELAGALILGSKSEVLRYADIVIVHDEVTDSDVVNKHQLFLTDVDYITDFASLFPMLGQSISLFSFSNENMKSCPIFKPRSFNSYYLGFIKYYLGEPVNADLISAISMAKVLENGKIVNQSILEQIESF